MLNNLCYLLNSLQRLVVKPTIILKLFWYGILIVVFSPKYLWLLFKRTKFIAFDWHWQQFGSFYYPLYSRLKFYFKDSIPIIFFFRFEQSGDKHLPTLKSGLPAIYRDLIDNKIVIAASSARYKKLPNTLRIQIFHGFASFGSVWPIQKYSDLFDVFFLPTFYTYKQLQHDYKEIVQGKKFFLIGYPKLDELIELSNCLSTNIGETTLFYGPTWHREISSIFEFLPTLVNICKNNNYRLVIKMHPNLYDKDSIDSSGGIDWLKRIHKYQNDFHKIILLERDTTTKELGRWFAKTNLFITDVSGIGYEFALSTGRPVVFLGKKLKIPLEDLRNNKIEQYSDHPEIYYRGVIGPLAEDPSELDLAIQKGLTPGKYDQEINKFRDDFVPNLGHASEKAVSTIIDLLKQID
jgi:hypothetical protein